VPHHFISTPKVFQSSSPFSQAVAATGARTIYIAGQVSQDETGANVGIGDPAVQADRVLANMQALVEADGATMADVCRIVVYVTDRAFLGDVMKARQKYFAKPYPATTVLVVAGLAHPDWLVEIDGVASVAE
jgi:enamine deaminase RidA (YjgF/YER057c/UK114 family)